MRIRTIKPEFWKHDGIAELEYATRLLFIALWCIADRRGRMEDRPRRIKAECFPYDELDVDAMLSELHSAGFIDRYEVEGVKIIEVRSFEKHQRLTGKEAETESIYPGKQWGSNGEAPGTSPVAQEGKGKEGKGKEEEGKGLHASAQEQAIPCSDFSPTQEHQDICAFRGASFEHQLARFRDLNKSANDTAQGWEARFRSFCSKSRPEVNQAPISPPAPRQEQKRPTWTIERDIRDEEGRLKTAQGERKECRDQRNRFSMGQSEFTRHDAEMRKADVKILASETRLVELRNEMEASK
jgi:hypothetical protein